MNKCPGFVGLAIKFGPPARFDYFLSWLPLGIQLPMPKRTHIGGVQNGAIKERIRHL
jgi:hypothetical protein